MPLDFITFAAALAAAGQGPQGEKGDPGAAGYTPVRGTDYWTEADITTMESYLNDYVNTVILGGAS